MGVFFVSSERVLESCIVKGIYVESSEELGVLM